MSETLRRGPVIPGFNRSLRVESRADRLTGDPGAVLLREGAQRHRDVDDVASERPAQQGRRDT